MSTTARDVLAHRDWARSLHISDEAAALVRESDVIDLHIDSFIWTRIFGYDVQRRHGVGGFDAGFYSQVDLPRLRDGGVTGGIWAITTNPLRGAKGRRKAFSDNLVNLQHQLTARGDVAMVRNLKEYRAAKALGKHAAFVGIQGGNALDEDLSALDDPPKDLIIQITLVHFTTSRIGTTSAPLPRWIRPTHFGLTDFGKQYVERLNEKRIFVDLAHIHRDGFWDALDVHDKTQPAIVTHTGIAGVFPHWRNLDDQQIKAIANTGGVVGVMYQASFLGDKAFSGRSLQIIRHMEHVIAVGGEDSVALGSDWDGAIVPPRDLKTCAELPKLVQLMLERGWTHERVRKTLGGNYLRALGGLRGES